MIEIIDITNLGECSGKELIDIRDNIEEYFPEYSPTEHTKIKELFKLVIRDGFPNSFVNIGITVYTFYGDLCFINQRKQICYIENDELCCTPIFRQVNEEEFHKRFHQNRDAINIEDRWRVDGTYSVQDYKLCDNYVSDDNLLTYAVHEGDIISVCRNPQSSHRGRAIMKSAVMNGGKKLDAYSGLFSFYTKTGFMPISICKWDNNFAPPGWEDAKAEEEDVVFFIYTGLEQDLKFSTWVNTVEYSENYMDAQAKRDSILKSWEEKYE